MAARYPQNAPTLFKTHLHLEGLYHLYNEGGTILDGFALFEWFYDWAPQMTGSLGRGIRARDEDSYKTPHGWEMVRELYVNYINGPWTLRVGKQMVVWGETGLQRTADVVNPVDLRSHLMGVDDWEDFKQGLWMFRDFTRQVLSMTLPLSGFLFLTMFNRLSCPRKGPCITPPTQVALPPVFGRCGDMMQLMNMVCIMPREVFVSGVLTGTGTGPSSIITVMTRLRLSGTGDRGKMATGPQ